MAVCPKCGAKIKKTDWRPNCWNCGVNIMYYGMEERLEADAERAAKEFNKFYHMTAGIKTSFIGSPLAYVRWILAILCIGSLCLPLATLSMTLPYHTVEGAWYGLVQTVMFVMDMDFGGILAAVGVMSGGHASLNALAAGGLLPVSAAETDSGIAFDNRYQVWTSDFEETLEGLPEDGTGRLEVEIGSVSLHVLESEEKTARIQGTGVRKAQAYVEDGTLYVRAESGKKQVKWLFGGGRRSTETEGEITLYLPEGFSAENASLNMGAGELVMDALRTDRLYCNVGMGSLEMRKLRAQDAEVSLGMGEVGLYDAEVSDMTADIGMGSMYMEGAVSQDLTASCGMGSLVMELAGSEGDYNYDVAASMGSVRVGERECAGMSAHWASDGKAVGNFDLDVSMGSVEIYFTNP